MHEITDRYDPFKILLHEERITALLSERVPMPVCIEIDPAQGFCNHSCIDCSYNSSTKGVLRLIDRDLLLSTLPEIAACAVQSIEWVGGSEPLLHPDISLFIAQAKKHGLRCGMVTNGSMLSKIYPNILAGDLDYIRISLDAASPEIYETTHRSRQFQKVLAQLREVIDRGADPSLFGISYRIMKENICDIVSAAELASELQIGYIQYKHSLMDDNTDYVRSDSKAIRQLLDRAEQFASSSFEVLGTNRLTGSAPAEGSFCTTSPLVGVITAGGDIPFCIRFRNKPEMYIGNIREGFANVWGGKRHKLLLAKVAREYCGYICKHHRYNAVMKTLKYPDDLASNIQAKKGVDINLSFI